MANNIIRRTWKQGGLVNIEDLRGSAFQAESGGHTFQISGVDIDGNPLALSGTPAGVLLRADGQDVTLTCSVSDGVVSATLPANAYVVPGRVGITIFLTSDGQKTAIYAAVGSVATTSSGTVAPPAGSDVVDLVNAIATAVATIPASYTDLMAAVAPTYSTSALYAVGSYAWYDGKLYRCTTAITSGETWTSGHWTLANLGSDVSDLKSALDADESCAFVKIKISQSEWAQGSINSSTGETASSTVKIRTGGEGIDRNIISIIPNSGYYVCIFVYDGDTYLGNWTGSGYVKSLQRKYDEIRINTIPANYKVRIMGSKSDNTDILPSEGENIFKKVTTDETLSKSGKSADAKTTGDEFGKVYNDIENIMSKSAVSKSLWTQGTIDSSSGETLSSNYKIRTQAIERNILSVIPSSGYYVCIFVYDGIGSGMGTYLGNWDGSTYTKALKKQYSEIKIDEIPQSYKVRIMASKTDDSSIVPQDGENIFVTSATDITLTKRGKAADAKAVGDALSPLDSLKALDGRTTFLFNKIRGKYICHIGVNKSDNIIIPCQSLADISRAKRLGFNCIEINVRMTSDGKYVCLHGTGGKFGAQFTDTEGESVADVSVSSMTLSEIKEGIRFKSKYDRYKTAPFTLQEMCYECKRLNMIPLVEYQNTYTDEIEILNQILGKNNYILGTYTYNRSAVGSDAIMASFLQTSTPESLMEKIHASGGAYIAGIDASASGFNSFTEADWKELAAAVHEEGYEISSAYVSEVLNQTMLKSGFDVMNTLRNINDIEYGNLANITDTPTFDGITTTGIKENGQITLSAEDVIYPTERIPSCFLGGSSLHITFSGTIILYMSANLSGTFTSNGEEELWFSTFVEEEAPSFGITAVSGTVIKSLSFKSSEM